MEMSDQPGAETEGASELRLKVAEGNAAGTVIQIEDELVIGRQATGEGSLAADIEISRRHARIARATEGRFVIEDLGSTNGTYVNGRRIESATDLEPGDRIEVGATTLVVQVRAIPPAAAQGAEVPMPTDPAGTEAPASPAAPATAAADADLAEAEPVEFAAPDPAVADPVPFAAPARISLRIELDLEEKTATLALDEDSEEIQLVLEDGRWRLE